MGTWRARGARLARLGLAAFDARRGSLKFSALLEVELRLVPGSLEGTVVASGSPLSWRWFSLGAFVGLGSRLDAWTIRLGPELTFTLHQVWGSFDGVQLFVRGSFPLLRGDVFSSQALLGMRLFIDLAA